LNALIFNKKVKTVLTAILTMSVVLIGFSMPIFAQSSDRAVFYISTEGNDLADGTIAAPFATLERARDAIRELKKEGGLPQSGATVYLREGSYERDKTFVLEQQDSGTDNAPIVYRAFPNENVTVSGGKKIKLADFTPVTDGGIIARLPKESRNKVLQFDLKNIGITKVDKMPLYGHGMSVLQQRTEYKTGVQSVELFLNNEEMKIARWPNEGYQAIDEVIDPGTIYMVQGKSLEVDGPPQGFTIKVNDKRLARWGQAKDIMMHGFWTFDWSDQSVEVDYVDANKMEIKSVQPHAFGVSLDRTGKFYVYNLLEEIDVPGEWYINKDDCMLYFYPPTDDTNSFVDISLIDDYLFSLNDTSNITIRGITFESSRGNGINIEEGFNNLISQCVIRNMAGCALDISGKQNGIISSEVYGMGNGGVRLSGGDRNTLTPAGNYAENNDIYKVDRISKTYVPAIRLSGVGNKAINNRLHESDHLIIQFSGNDHIIERNEIFDAVKNSDDMGAIYTGRDWTTRGNIIKNNYFRDINNVIGPLGVFAIYTDDSTSEAYINGNIFHNVYKALFSHGGRDHVVQNNVVIDSKSSFSFRVHNPNSIDNHLVTLMERLDGVPYQNEIWAKRYPSLVNILNDDYKVPKNNTVERNVFIETPAIDAAEQALSTGKFEDNIEMSAQEAKFVDVSSKNFALKEDSEIYKKLPDFDAIPFEKIGMYTQRAMDKIKDAVVLYIGSPYTFVYKNSKQIDSDNIDVIPIIENGRTLVPVRFISESFGAQVGWDETTDEVTVTLGEKIIKMTLEQDVISVNGQDSKLDVPAKAVNGRTLIPLRALVESLDKKVFWDPQGLIVISDDNDLLDTAAEQDLIDEIARILTVN